MRTWAHLRSLKTFHLPHCPDAFLYLNGTNTAQIQGRFPISHSVYEPHLKIQVDPKKNYDNNIDCECLQMPYLPNPPSLPEAALSALYLANSFVKSQIVYDLQPSQFE